MTPTPAEVLTVGSLFSGIGGIDLGLERAGHRVLWQVERDEFCRKVLAKHWPHVPCYEDIHDVGAHNLAPVDLVAGGFPCQPVSVAGKRLGQDDPRWLWPEFARIIRELRPRYALMENVPGLLVRGMGDVLGDLAAIGYDAEWGVLSAADMGAPHLRRRVFVLAYPHDERRGTQPLCFTEREDPTEPWDDGEAGLVAHPNGIGLEGPEQERERRGLPGDCGSTLAHPNILGPQRRDHAGIRKDVGESGDQPPGGRSAGRDWWASEPNVGRVAHGVPARVDRLRALGNAVVPQVAEWIGRRLT